MKSVLESGQPRSGETSLRDYVAHYVIRCVIRVLSDTGDGKKQDLKNMQEAVSVGSSKPGLAWTHSASLHEHFL